MNYEGKTKRKQKPSGEYISRTDMLPIIYLKESFFMNCGFGGGNCCWIIIILIVLFFCCGNGGSICNTGC